MKKINLFRKALKLDKSGPTYVLGLEIISSEGISKEIFVKQRQRDNKQANNDVFVAVAANYQLEDLDVDSPKAGTSYFRTDNIELVASNPAYLDKLFDTILSEIQSLVDNAEVIDEISPDGIYEITADTIEVNMGTIHTHYRIPLVAQPCGGNEIFTEASVQKHRVSSQNTSLPGWLNITSGVDPTGTYFKYNIATDSTLSSKWPITTEFVPYARIEINGVTSGKVLINANGIFWKTNLLGKAPWPVDYVNSGNTGSAVNAVTLVLDFIV